AVGGRVFSGRTAPGLWAVHRRRPGLGRVERPAALVADRSRGVRGCRCVLPGWAADRLGFPGGWHDPCLGVGAGSGPWPPQGTPRRYTGVDLLDRRTAPRDSFRERNGLALERRGRPTGSLPSPAVPPLCSRAVAPDLRYLPTGNGLSIYRRRASRSGRR